MPDALEARLIRNNRWQTVRVSADREGQSERVRDANLTLQGPRETRVIRKEGTLA